MAMPSTQTRSIRSARSIQHRSVDAGSGPDKGTPIEEGLVVFRCLAGMFGHGLACRCGCLFVGKFQKVKGESRTDGHSGVPTGRAGRKVVQSLREFLGGLWRVVVVLWGRKGRRNCPLAEAVCRLHIPKRPSILAPAQRRHRHLRVSLPPGTHRKRFSWKCGWRKPTTNRNPLVVPAFGLLGISRFPQEKIRADGVGKGFIEDAQSKSAVALFR